MAMPVKGCPPSLQNDDVIRHPAPPLPDEFKAGGRLAASALTRNQDPDPRHLDQDAVNHDPAFTQFPDQADQPALQQRRIVGGGKNGRPRFY
jgi:hypothetical protein